MPQYRRATVLAPEDPGTSGTEIMQIYLKEIVSRLVVRFGITINTVSVMTAALAESITKIEIVDGSTVLYSLSGPEAVASNFYRTGKLPIEYKSLTVGDIAYFDVSIMFGRWLWDTTLAFDPTRFVSPQLRITWDSTTANAGVTVETLAVYADVIDNPAQKPTGIILSKDQNQYNMAASSHEYIDLPVDYSLWNILVRAKSDAYSPSSLFSNFKFSYDQDAYIFVDQDAGQYIDALAEKFPHLSIPSKLDGDVTADTLYVIPTENQFAVINHEGTGSTSVASVLSTPTFAGNKLSLGASVNFTKRSIIVKGTCPHGVMPFMFGMLDDPTTWYKPQVTTKFRADLYSSSNAASTDTVYLATEQLRPY